MISTLLDIFFPHSCAVCQTMTRHTRLCEKCAPSLPWINGSVCPVCGIPFVSDGMPMHPCGACLTTPPSFDWHRSPLKYEGAVVPLIHSFKFKERLDLTPLFSSWMARDFPVTKPDWLIPIPLALGRLRQRSFNQSLELAWGLSRLTGVPLLRHSLQKIRETEPQTGLKKKDRRQNLKGSFRWAGRISLEGKRVVLIDDVYTTGSTLSTAALVLRSQNPSEIAALTVARAL